jgi:hypothetical protein
MDKHHPGATDCSELTGLLRVDGTTKVWGKTFQQLSARYSGTHIAPVTSPALDRRGQSARRSYAGKASVNALQP